ncbi:MAG: ABC transporter permease [Rhodospirillaceae bacterium]|jgi:putative spermidine/putrescine transport system permease protein|nr:ABC transporter permease [Rhodospirillaceae bacterium]MBT3925495.1 ABC transporter permease [Rhodospirillaceae bacterium]MBT4425579.1 ABC transporter permease [Rhodospirillaceae bacterium]MBT5039307.1 ABC transporter permease [Rhodospirillaceae bacterium]MBT5674586.1 ABC transporter permease [Rhodospirillaceae bacterium]
MAGLTAIFNRYSTLFQISPLVITLTLFLVGPVIVIIILSLWKFDGFMTLEGVWTFRNYEKIFTRSLTVTNYLQTGKMLLITLVVTFVLGFTLAYFLVFDLVKLRTKMLLFLLCVVPFWTSAVIRTVAWMPFLGTEGIINQAVVGIGLSDEPLKFLLFSEFAVLLSYIQIFTLFMMAPLFNVMARINKDLIEAARDNGASSIQILWNIILPLCKPGIAIGTIFVIALVASDFTTIRILSGSQVGTVAASMANQIYNVQYPPAAATAMILLLAVLLLVGGIMRLVDVRRQL